MYHKRNRIGYHGVSQLIWIFILIIGGYGLLQVFICVSFRIPSDSMNPTLRNGDHVLVFKPLIGARIFNVFQAIHSRPAKIYRIPGIRGVTRNDILVFNNPFPNQLKKMEMSMKDYYIKRCIGLPGDSLSIESGYFKVKGYSDRLGNDESQQLLSRLDDHYFDDPSYKSWMSDSTFGWTIKNLGPLYIPQKGDSIEMDKKNYCLYKELIAWEQGMDVWWKNGIAYLNDQPLKSYRFKSNYYFMVGDNLFQSYDSRYWGLLPEELIVGKACLIWKSIHPTERTLRKDRIMKRIK